MTYRKRDGFVTRNVAGETVIVPVAGKIADLESIFTLNEVATVIWDRIDGAAGAEQLAAAVCEEFEVEPDAARADVDAFLQEASQAGLIDGPT